MKLLYSCKLFFCLFFLLFCNTVSAQTGPGGVGSNNGLSNLQVWLRADAIPTVANGTQVDFPDLSGNNRTATNAGGATVGVRATYLANQANTFPVVRFNGLNTTAGSQYDNAYNYSAQSVVIVYKVSSIAPNPQQGDDLGQLWGDFRPSGIHVAATLSFKRFGNKQ